MKCYSSLTVHNVFLKKLSRTLFFQLLWAFHSRFQQPWGAHSAFNWPYYVEIWRRTSLYEFHGHLYCRFTYGSTNKMALGLKRPVKQLKITSSIDRSSLKKRTASENCFDVFIFFVTFILIIKTERFAVFQCDGQLIPRVLFEIFFYRKVEVGCL